MRGVSTVRSASKRLLIRLSLRTRKAGAGAGSPLTSISPRFTYSKRLPTSRRVFSGITISSGPATACNRAARLVPDNPKVGVHRANWYEPGLNRTYLGTETADGQLARNAASRGGLGRRLLGRSRDRFADGIAGAAFLLLVRTI